MNKAKKLYLQVAPMLEKFSWEKVWPLLKHVSEKTMYAPFGIVYETNTGSLYRPFIYELCKMLKPKQVVELGGHEGRTTSMFLAALPETSTVIVVDSQYKMPYVDDPRCIKLFGDDLNMDLYQGIDLSKTDIWFIDTVHTKEQLEKEFNAFQQYWHPGTIVLVDDIWADEKHGDREFTSKEYWKTIPYDKINIDKLHRSYGFGIIVV